MAGCFYINAASFIPLLIALFFIDPIMPAAKEKTASFRDEVGEAISFLGANKKLLALLGVVAIFSMFGVAYIILMPIFAQDILAQGSKGFAVLMSMNGAGALAGVLNLARLKHSVSKNNILRVCVIIFCVSLMIFALSGSFVLSSLMLFLAGFGGSSSLSLVNTLFQVSIPDNYRGRLMGVYCMMFMGLLPFGNIFAGLFAQLWNVQAVVFCGALLSLFFYFIVYESRFVKRYDDFQH
jgi:predicted MFS family arabinose efflux permease